MLVVMVLMASLLSAGAIALQLQISSSRSAGYLRQQQLAFYCAEAGLQAERNRFAAQQEKWGHVLDNDPQTDPGSWYPVVGYAPNPDPNGQPMQYQVTMRDNDDYGGDPLQDTDKTIIIESRCLSMPDMPQGAMELITFTGGNIGYTGQDGQGSLGTNNANASQ